MLQRIEGKKQSSKKFTQLKLILYELGLAKFEHSVYNVLFKH
jgi:hypothetical protein